MNYNVISVVNTVMDYFMSAQSAHWSFRTLQLAMIVFAIANLVLMCLCAESAKIEVSITFLLGCLSIEQLIK